MSRRLTNICATAAAALLGIVTLGQMVGAQTSAPWPSLGTALYSHLVYNVITADFDRNGRPDFVAGRPSNVGGSDLVVWYGDSNGAIGNERVLATASWPLAVGDLNDDGAADIVAGTIRGQYVYLGHGDGTFAAPVQANSGPAGDRALLADFDGDGALDMAEIRRGQDWLDIYRGHGDGTFAVPVRFTTDNYLAGMVAADFNEDGKIDLAVATRNSRLINLYVNRGGLTFATSAIPIDRAPLALAAADVDGDGVGDLIISAAFEEVANPTTFADGAVYVWHGNGDGTFRTIGTYQTNNGPMVIALGDFNRDGRLDIATGNRSTRYDAQCDAFDMQPDNVSILPGVGGGGFGPAASFSPLSQLWTADLRPPDVVGDSLLAIDVNGDGFTDLIGGGIAFLNQPATANARPRVDAGPDRRQDEQFFALSAQSDDANRDWLTFEWRNDAGEIIGHTPRICAAGNYSGRHAFTVTATDDRGASAVDSVTLDFSTGPQQPWTSNDVGRTGVAGRSSYDGNTYTVSGGGGDVWNALQEFQWIHTTFTGPFEFVARVAAIENVNQWTKAGIMMRVGGTDKRYVFLTATPTTAKGVSWQWGNRDGGSIASPGPSIAPPVWLRLQRLPSGNIQASWRRNDTDAWTALGQLGMADVPPTVEVGLAVSSHVRGKLATAQFDHVSLTRDTTGLPAGWQARDIGGVLYGGGVTWATTGHVMLNALGADIWDTADEFQFVSTSRNGDVDISAQVTDVQNVNAWTKAGLMIRASGEEPSAVHASVFVTPGKGIAFQRRRDSGGPSFNTQVLGITAPVWLRLTSIGGTVTAYYRRNATDPWTSIGIDKAIDLPSTLDVGLALSSHVDNARAGAGFSAVTIR